MGPLAISNENSIALATTSWPNSDRTHPSVRIQVASVPTQQEPAATVCPAAPYMMHSNPAGFMPSHCAFQQPADIGLGALVQDYSLLRRSSSCASSLKSLAAHVQHELLQQQGPKQALGTGTQVLHTAAATAPTSPRTPNGSPRDSPSTAAVSSVSAAVTLQCSSPLHKQQQHPGIAAQAQCSSLMALADAAVACQRQETGQPADVQASEATAAAAAASGRRGLGVDNAAALPSIGPVSGAHASPLPPPAATGAAAAAADVTGNRPLALQCAGFNNVYSNCSLSPAAAAAAAAAAAGPLAAAAAAYTTTNLEESLTPSSHCAAAASTHLEDGQTACLTKASLQDRLSQELEQSPLLTLLLSRLVRRLRQQQHGSTNADGNQICGPTQQQQQHVSAEGNAEYAVIMPGVLQKQHAKIHSSSVSSGSSSCGSSEYRAVRLTKRSYVELPAGCLLVGPGGTVGCPPPAAAAAAGFGTVGAFGAAEGMLPKSQQQQQQRQQQQQGLPSRSSGLLYSSAAAGITSQLVQQQCCQLQHPQVSQPPPPAPAAAGHTAVQQQQPTAPFAAPQAASEAPCLGSIPQINFTVTALPSQAAVAAAVTAATLNISHDTSGKLSASMLGKRSREQITAVTSTAAAVAAPLPKLPQHPQPCAPVSGTQSLVRAGTVSVGVPPRLGPIMEPAYKRQSPHTAAAVAAAAGSHSSIAWQQQQGQQQQQLQIPRQRWLSAPSPLTCSYPK